MSVAIAQACPILHRAKLAGSNKPPCQKLQITSTEWQSNSKSQAPNSKQGPNIKFQIPNEEQEEETDSKFQTKKRTW
jgi:hypothetical protein